MTGWTPDSRRVVFASGRASAPNQGVTKFWTVSVEGGAEDAMAMPRGAEGDHSPDGQRFALASRREVSAVKQDKVVFIFNFFDELRRIAPVGGRAASR